MWLGCDIGWFSVVESPESPGTMLCVRARYADDLDRLRKRVESLGPTQVTVERDYPYRAFVRRTALADGVRDLVLSISYKNYKQAAREVLGNERELQLERVWSIMANSPRPPALRRKSRPRS